MNLVDPMEVEEGRLANSCDVRSEGCVIKDDFQILGDFAGGSGLITDGNSRWRGLGEVLGMEEDVFSLIV